jgi:butyryl-CoA dehydrogenase
VCFDVPEVNMDYSKSWPNLDESQKMLMDSIHQFSNEVVAPRAAHHDETGEFPVDTVRQMAGMGLMGMMVEEEWGGSGLTTLDYAMAMEAISAACASTGVIMSVNNSLVCFPIQAFGNDHQKGKFL